MADGKSTTAQRASYRLFVGTIDEARHIDHRCHTRSCVNPAHLRVVTPKQNAENKRKTRGRSRHLGVTPSGRGWKAQTTHLGQYHYLGTFDTEEEAAEAARMKRVELFTHNDLDRIGS